MNERELTRLLTGDGEIVTERLDHWAAVAGDRTFFYYGEDDATLTYADFARQTNAIAGNLARLGVGKGDRVSVFCRNSLTSALMMFGIWKAGVVYCPVNFAYTGRLLTYQLNDKAPRLIVTDGASLPALNDVLDAIAAKPTIAVYKPSPGAHDHIAEQPAVRSGFAEIAWSELVWGFSCQVIFGALFRPDLAAPRPRSATEGLGSHPQPRAAHTSARWVAVGRLMVVANSGLVAV